MPNFAQTIIMGHLGSDPEVRYSQGGTPIANFSVAVSEKWKDKNTGEMREETEWYRVVSFGPSAENYIAKYLHKGDVCLVRGKMKTRKWQDSDGHDRYSTELVADRFGGVQGVGGSSRKTENRPPTQNRRPDPQAPPKDFDDDLPF